MDQQSIVTDIEKRARAIGLPIGQLCDEAPLARSTFSRWKRSRRNPKPINATIGSINSLYDALRVHEQKNTKVVPLTQGGEAASRLAHNQEDAGSSPAPATSGEGDGEARTVTCMTCGERPDDPRVRGCTFADCPHAEREAA